MKHGTVIKSMSPASQDMELINRLSRRELKEDEVYIFSVVLCDNEVDRDYERFTNDTLRELAALFVGKTGIADHDRKSANQCARVYDARVVVKEGEKNSLGEDYACIEAKAYIPRIKSNEDLIERIDSGILKEVSVGCSVGKSVCSICGKTDCSHVRGHVYGGVRCIRQLTHATDAYEFSFVAVPAQRKAGVTKTYIKGDERPVIEKLKAAAEGEEVILTAEEVKEIRKQLSWGEAYRDSLLRNIRKYSRILQPQLSSDVVDAMTQALDVDKLKELEAVYGGLADERMPVVPQTAAKKSGSSAGSNVDFTI